MGLALGLGIIFFLCFVPFAVGFLIGVIVMLRKWVQTKKTVPLVLAVISFLCMLVFLAVAGLGLFMAYGAADYGGLV